MTSLYLYNIYHLQISVSQTNKGQHCKLGKESQKKLDKNMTPPLSLPNGTDFTLKLYAKHVLVGTELF